MILAGAALLLAGCATRAPTVVTPTGDTFGELEPLYSASAGREALTIRVSSNGCTRKEDFAFYLESRGEARTLAFGRKRLDQCKSFAMGHADLSFTWSELGVPPNTPVFLLNPMVPWTGPGA